MLTRHELFISYSSNDEALATELCTELELGGFSCWIAPRDIEPGVEYSQSLTAAISNASMFLLVLSTNASLSKHVRRELEIADRRGIPILPVRVEDTKSFGDLDYFVTTQQWCDVIARPLGSNLGNLKETLRKRLGDPELERLWRERGGHLANRYAVRRPRALLSLDGGGVRGLISLEILGRIEALLAKQSSDPSAFRLCDWFDFIAGSGSGGLIAIALARGCSTREVLAFFVAHASEMFGQKVRPFESFFLPAAAPRSSRLAKSLGELIGLDATLSPESLRCLLMVVVRSLLANAPWPLTNNPLAKYSDLARSDSLRRLPLLPLARASMTWSPWADPEVLGSAEPWRAVGIGDGTFTPYSNPAFLLYQTVTSEAYRLKWNRGERNLLLISVGAGEVVNPMEDATSSPALQKLLTTFMRQSVFDQDLKCRMVGRCIHGAWFDHEIGDLIPRDRNGKAVTLLKDIGREFTYVRYDVELAPTALVALGANDPYVCDQGRTFDLSSGSNLESIRGIGRLAAGAVSEEHFRAVQIPDLVGDLGSV